MDVKNFLDAVGAEFFTGVPDSQLKALCDYLAITYENDPERHIIAANEGNAAALAAGYHLATGKVPLVYMQNSGEGNIVNPVASLTREEVYGIPTVFVIGWRGEPGVHDEPQHIYQGKITLELLDVLGIEYMILSKDTEVCDVERVMNEKWTRALGEGKSVAFVVRKGALTTDIKPEYKNDAEMTREEIISHIISFAGDDPVVSTTGKASRELFELREAKGEGHSKDFLTVGSMGHASSIALSVALAKKDTTVWCIDGDGAALMHMGALAVAAKVHPENLIHIVINNGAHETVGGMPTAASGFSFTPVALSVGYDSALSVSSPDELDSALQSAKMGSGLRFIEAKCSIGARENLGRPTTTARENKEAFMEHLSKL